MGCTYEELGLFGRLRKIEKLGPFSMWQKLCQIVRVHHQSITFIAHPVLSLKHLLGSECAVILFSFQEASADKMISLTSGLT